MLNDIYNIGVKAYLTKQADWKTNVLDAAGDIRDATALGVLAAPYVAKKTGHPIDEDVADTMEIGGLAALGIPHGAAAAKTLLQKGKV